ncbi:MAG: hypothetical protein IE933_03710 [Sphingomonadales bacterium]|nr:hypothetical protein [Sphingomonadales bacterium]MBD3772150.1 hypothetical protein [Paracoccaceae bacterium]
MRGPFAVIAAGMLFASPALAQDAAEEAMITSTTGPATGSAARTLGGAVSGSITGAADSIRATRSGAATGRTGSGARTSRSAGTPRAGGYWIPPRIDPLEYTNAATYRVGNGSVIRVSGLFDPAPGTHCIRFCPTD